MIEEASEDEAYILTLGFLVTTSVTMSLLLTAFTDNFLRNQLLANTGA